MAQNTDNSESANNGQQALDNTLAPDTLKDNNQDTYAAIDLGSNSFHMAVAQPEGRSIRIIDSLRAPVRLGAGLDNKKNITPATEEMALETLSQFSERLRDVPRKNIRIVGTNTLRRARNSDDFIEKAYDLLGKRIEIISGREEARLIFGSVAHTQPDNNDRKLVIDIGGGSTELITGSGTVPDVMESFNMGCVSAANNWFDGPQIEQHRLRGATVHAQLELQPMAENFIQSGWDSVFGCSGTIKASARMLFELGLSDVEGEITWSGIKKLQKELIKAGSVEKLRLETISKDRMQVIAGGISILAGIMKTLSIKHIQVSQVALREGLIFNMLGKSRHADIQSHTVRNIARRFQVDTHQADRVEKSAIEFFEAAVKPWKLDADTDASLLRWAAWVHEIGMSVAHTQYHKHGAYLIENSDLMGFTRAEQTALALMVRYHRRKFDREAFDPLPKAERERLLRLTVLLRLAILKHRSRRDINYPKNSFLFKSDKIRFEADQEWLDSHPLTNADLSDEAKHLDNAGFDLKVK